MSFARLPVDAPGLLSPNPSNPGANRDPVPGGHAGRPYEKTASGSVGADFISARCCRVGCTFAERLHRRGAHRASGTGYEFRKTASRCTRSRRHVGMPPYARSGWRADGGIGPYEGKHRTHSNKNPSGGIPSEGFLYGFTGRPQKWPSCSGRSYSNPAWPRSRRGRACSAPARRRPGCRYSAGP